MFGKLQIDHQAFVFADQIGKSGVLTAVLIAAQPELCLLLGDPCFDHHDAGFGLFDPRVRATGRLAENVHIDQGLCQLFLKRREKAHLALNTGLGVNDLGAVSKHGHVFAHAFQIGLGAVEFCTGVACRVFAGDGR